MNNGRKTETKKRGFGDIAVLSLVLFAVLAIISFVIIIITFNSSAKKDNKEITYHYGSFVEIRNLADVTVNSSVYVDFERIAVLCDMSKLGSENDVTYSISKENDKIGESIRLVKGENSVYLNGEKFAVGGNILNISGDLWLPFSSLEEIFSTGMSCTYDEATATVTVRRVELNASTQDNPIYDDITFVLKEAKPLPAGENLESMAVPMFQTDLSAYEEYMNPADRDAYLILVNRDNVIGEDYIPENLTDVKNTRAGYPTQKLRECAAKALEALFIEAKANGVKNVSVTSAYRSYASQVYYFNYYIQQEMSKGLSEEAAKIEVMTYSAPPGTSEHQTGLAADMHNMNAASDEFAKTSEYQWLSQNAHKFGFILRFPEGKEDLTGYNFESWHFRFVGRYHATKIYNSGLCLEEYIKQLSVG